jgi:hypothetical protein
MKKIIFLLALLSFAESMVFISCNKEYSCEGCAEKPPIAVAGPDLVITLPTDSVSLDGNNSSDPDGTISKWLWTKISGPASFNIIRQSDSISKVKTLVVGTYEFELKVTDNDGLSAKDTVQVIVNDPSIPNRPPVANAGADQTIILPTITITLNGNGSTDPDNNITSYLWAKISGPSSFSIINTSATQTLVTNLIGGVYQFELKVTDAGGLFSKDTMQVTVNVNSPNNLPPVAVAGNDTTIQNNQNPCSPFAMTVTLNGSNSFDPDGTINSYSWTGPGTISNPNSPIAQANGLYPGVYRFILRVIDNSGGTDDDTIVVNIFTRPLVNAQLIPVNTLSITREGIAIASAGNKILFAGGYTSGYTNNFQVYSRVDIFDISTNSWTIAELSQARTNIGVAVLNNKIYFAGGEYAGGFSSRVDIYDAITNSWTSSELSQKRSLLAGAAAGNKVLFAGGYGAVNSAPPVDILDINTNLWSVDSLRNRPTQFITGDAGIAATVIGNKIYFAGNASDWLAWDFGSITSTINIYDVTSNTWSNSDLSIHRGFMASIAIGNKTYWAGGVNDQSNNYTNLVEIRDANSGISTFDCLSHSNAFFSAVQKNNKIVFFTLGPNMPVMWPSSWWQNVFDIYDITSNTWSVGVLPATMASTSIISVNNVIYLAGGLVNGVVSNQVYKLEF